VSTKIEWTDDTWNPIVGCAAVSPGCDNCYAARDASGRLRNVPAYKGLAVNGVFTGEVRELPERLDQPLRWAKPKRIFVNSMSDLFHVDVTDAFRDQVFDVMHDARWHQFQVLTKRPQLMRNWVREYYERRLGPDHVIPNLWLGTSIESNRYRFRAFHLARTPAAIRFLSCEPLLGPLPDLDLTDIDWVIVGGESGPRARPMHPEWARDLRDRCNEAGVAFLFKQWGEWQLGSVSTGDYQDNERVVFDDGRTFPTVNLQLALDEAGVDDNEFQAHRPVVMTRVGKHKAGRLLDRRTWDEYPDG
jgi:protein gp37